MAGISNYLPRLSIKYWNRYLLLIVVLVMFALFTSWITPRILTLYYESKGGQILEKISYSYYKDDVNQFFCTFNLIKNESLRRQLEQAIVYLKKAAKFLPSSPQTYLLLGRAYCLSGQPAQAIAAYETFSKLRPKNPLGHLELGFAYEQQENMEQATREWQAGGISAQEIMNSGNEELNNKHFNNAVQWFTRAVAMGDNKAPCFRAYASGLVFQQEESWEKAIASFSEAARLDIKCSGSSYYHIGLIEQDKLQKWLDALEYYDKAIESENFISNLDLADTHYRRGRVMKYQNIDVRQAMTEFQLAINANPNQYGALLELGWSYWQVDGNFSKAEETLKKAISANRQAKYAYLALGNLYYEAKMLADSLKMYKMVLTIDPKDQTAIERSNEIQDNIEQLIVP